MKAIRVSQFGGPEVLKLEETADPTPGPGEVRVKIAAVGINPVETYIRAGTYPALPKLPFTPGNDGAGTIDAVGEGVIQLKVGDRVYIAGSTTGTYAEKALAKVDNVRIIPDSVAFEEAAGIGVPYITAYRAIFEKAQVRPGETVLVHGGTGAVGLAAIQFLSHFDKPWHATADDSKRQSVMQRLQPLVNSRRDFMRELIRLQARLVIGTEAAAFFVKTENGALTLERAAHVRNDGSDLDVLAAAMQAFEKIVMSCVSEDKEGAVHIEGTWDGADSQYCLVNLLRDRTKAVAATAIIAKARDLDRARKLLDLAGMMGGHFELLRPQLNRNPSNGPGVTLIATGGTDEGRSLVHGQGAQHVLNHKDNAHFDEIKSITGGRGVDVILETTANKNLGKDLTVLATGGRVVVIGSRGEVTINPRDLMKADGQILGLLGTFEHRDAAHAAIGAGLRGGWLKPIVSKRFSLAEAGKAHEAVTGSSANGKLVLVVD